MSTDNLAQVGTELPAHVQSNLKWAVKTIVLIGLCATGVFQSSHVVAKTLDPVVVIGKRLTHWWDWWDWWDSRNSRSYYDRDFVGGGGGGGGAFVLPPVNALVEGRNAEQDTCVGNPIIRSTGNKIEPETDFSTNGELPLTLERTYNHYWQGVGLFGKYWVSSFDYKLTFGTTKVDECYPRPGGGGCNIGNNTVIYAWRPDGRTIKYTKESDGFYYEDKPGPLSKIERLSDDSFILYRAEGGRERYSSGGYINYVEDYSRTIRWSFSYKKGTTYPTRITHTSGRTVEFTWDNGQLTSVRDPAGNDYRYTYAANRFGTGLHQLASTTQPGTPTTTLTYHYEQSDDASALTGKSFNGTRYSKFTYDSKGYATSSEHSGQDKYTFAYTPGSNGKLTVKETNPLGKQTTYVYVNGKITTVTGHPSANCPTAMHSLTEYDANGYPTMTSDFNGNLTAYTYNDQGQLLKKIEAYDTPIARTTTYKWSDASQGNRILSVTVAGVSRTDYQWDGGRISSISVTDLSPNGVENQRQETLFSYTFHPRDTSAEDSVNQAGDAPEAGSVSDGLKAPPPSRGMLATMRVNGPLPGNADEVISTYDTLGNLLSEKNSLGHGKSYSAHTKLGLPGLVQGANGDKTGFRYDARGRITLVRTYPNDVAADTNYTYNAYGNVVEIKTPDGVTTQLGYDIAQRLMRRYVDSETVLADNGIREEERYTYNAMSQPTSVTIARIERTYSPPPPEPCPPPARHCQPESIDAAPTRPPATTDATSSVITYQQKIDYDELGRVRAKRGNNGQVTRYSYDLNGNLKTTRDALGRTTTLYYDALNRVIQSKDPAGNSTWYVYNPLDQVTRVTDPRGKVTRYIQDGFGQRLRQISPDTGTTRWAYDPYGRMSSETRADGTVTQFSYDGLGRLTSRKVGNQEHLFSYDSCTLGKGRLCSATAPNGSITYAYTRQGQLATQHETIGSGAHKQAFVYDNMGRLTGIGYTGNVSVGYGYQAGKLTTMTAKVGDTRHTIVKDVKYQPFGGAASWTYGNGLTRGYNYDLDGRITGISVKNANTVLQSLTYAHNSDDTIKAITNAVNRHGGGQITYDALSRLTKYVTGANNSSELTYDAVGNRTRAVFGGSTERTDTYTTDPDSNQLTSTSGGRNRSYSYDANGNTLSDGQIHYSYDAFNRMSGAVKDGATTSYWTNALGLRTYKSPGSPKKATEFVHGPDRQLVMELNKAGPLRTHYLRMGGEVVAMVRGGEVYYAHNDHLGRTEMLTNSDKTKVWHANLYPFASSVQNDQVGGFNLGFPGQYQDSETGTWYNGYRNYDQNTGRYIQSDPIGLAGGINTYAYVMGNPVNAIDPLGLKATCKCTDSGAEININFKFKGDGATPETIAAMRSSIESRWSAPGFTVTTSIGGWGASKINVPATNGRSFVQGNGGTWYGGADPWVAAHEAGHLMKLNDRYTEPVRGTTIPQPGWEGTIMAQHMGAVTPADRQGVLDALGCNCACGGGK